MRRTPDARSCRSLSHVRNVRAYCVACAPTWSPVFTQHSELCWYRKTRSRAPVVIKTNQRSMATVCDHCAVCGTVILQACSRLRKAVALEEYASQRLSFLLSHRRIAQCSKVVIDGSVNVSKGCFCSPVKMKRGHCLRSSRSRLL